MMALPFYLLGHYAKDYIHKIVTNKYGLFIGLLCLIITIVITTYQGKSSMFSLVYGKNVDPPYNVLLFYTNSLIGSFMLLFFSAKVKYNQKITNLATSLITILGVQIFFIDIQRHSIGLNQPWYLNIIISFVILMLCYYIHKLLMKYTPQLLGKF